MYFVEWKLSCLESYFTEAGCSVHDKPGFGSKVLPESMLPHIHQQTIIQTNDGISLIDYEIKFIGN